MVHDSEDNLSVTKLLNVFQKSFCVKSGLSPDLPTTAQERHPGRFSLYLVLLVVSESGIVWNDTLSFADSLQRHTDLLILTRIERYCDVTLDKGYCDVTLATLSDLIVRSDMPSIQRCIV